MELKEMTKSLISITPKDTQFLQVVEELTN